MRVAESGDLKSELFPDLDFFKTYFFENLKNGTRTKGQASSKPHLFCCNLKNGTQTCFSKISNFQKIIFHPFKTIQKCVQMIPYGTCDMFQPNIDSFRRPKLTLPSCLSTWLGVLDIFTLNGIRVCAACPGRPNPVVHGCCLSPYYTYIPTKGG